MKKGTFVMRPIGTLTIQNGFLINASGPAPAPPSLISPQDSAAINGCIPTFNWSAPLYAYTYELLVGDDSSFTNSIIQ